MSANLYDLLNVDESATPDEIRVAWKAAIADLDPSDRRFRAYNDAAGVLLDDGKRASYDAELAQGRLDAEQEVESEPPSAAVTAAIPVKVDLADDPKAVEPKAVEPRGPRVGPSTGALIGTGVAAGLALLLALVVVLLPGVRADPSPKDAAKQALSQDRTTLAVESAAEQLVAPVLSYNHKTMDADLERLKGYVTDQMADKQSKAWPEITKEAQAQQIVVEATATGTALARIDPDGNRATVVVFIDQYVQKKSAEPFVLKMWATLLLVRDGGDDGRWLLDDLCTDDSCS
ncbi:MAG: hypothetical protein NTX33_10205 [Propionibacteriales bacterium]|nr:hypothetical protein [Propionibacteriales bacterium]